MNAVDIRPVFPDRVCVNINTISDNVIYFRAENIEMSGLQAELNFSSKYVTSCIFVVNEWEFDFLLWVEDILDYLRIFKTVHENFIICEAVLESAYWYTWVGYCNSKIFFLMMVISMYLNLIIIFILIIRMPNPELFIHELKIHRIIVICFRDSVPAVDLSPGWFDVFVIECSISIRDSDVVSVHETADYIFVVDIGVSMGWF